MRICSCLWLSTRLILFMYALLYVAVCVLCWYVYYASLIVWGVYGLVCVVVFALVVWFSIRRCICHLWVWFSIRR